MPFFGRARPRLTASPPESRTGTPSTLPPPYSELPPSPSLPSAQAPLSSSPQSWCPNSYPLSSATPQGLLGPSHLSSQISFQPAGLLPSPPTWTPPQPVTVMRPYYLPSSPYLFQSSPPPPPPPPPPLPPALQQNTGLLGQFGSVTNLAGELQPEALNVAQHLEEGAFSWPCFYTTPTMSQAATTVYDQLSNRFNHVMTLIDGEQYADNEKDLFSYPAPVSEPLPIQDARPDQRNRSRSDGARQLHRRGKGRIKTMAASASAGTSYVAKVELYANSRLPLDLPPLRLYLSTYPLLCLAAQYSERAYKKPRGAERDTHVGRAMIIKSVPMDHMNVIVFAIRGSATFMDWYVNLHTEPKSPEGFLDDSGNLCHAGFLGVARQMIRPVAQRLRQLLDEEPNRATYSLLITGHSAGGAIASLLYCHMLATSEAAASELNALAGRFRRIHCVTFGTPPTSLLPLEKPSSWEVGLQHEMAEDKIDDEGSGDQRHPRRTAAHRSERRRRKSLFMTFFNEGDPVARVDRAYLSSLFDLFASPAPTAVAQDEGASSSKLVKPSPQEGKLAVISGVGASEGNDNTAGATDKTNGGRPKPRSHSSPALPPPRPARPTWELPPCELSVPGRIVVLRSGDAEGGRKHPDRARSAMSIEERLNEGVVAQVATDEQLRGVVWGDPASHTMRLYSGRVETLAVGAVTAQGG